MRLRYDAVNLKMLSEDVYASVIWALVLATFASPFMFRWALTVFDRATPIRRSTYIGGDRQEFARRAFIIRLAGHYSPGVQREIFDVLRGSGVDILEARMATVRADDSADADIESFVNNFTVLSRGKRRESHAGPVYRHCVQCSVPGALTRWYCVHGR